ncbi:hypothetical protein L7F22_041517 [Adiantum nelumboides]|nr:hypothetical protein [Adiantum nelumboides]
MANPALQGEVQQQLHAYGILPPPKQERDPEKSHGETSKRGLSAAREVENPYQELKQLLEGKPSFKKKGHAQHERSPSREREESKSQDESMEDVAPRKRRAQRSPTPTKRKRSPHSPHRRESKREEKSSRKKKERKRSPSSPSSSPSSSFDKGSGYSSQEKQRRGHQRSYAAWKRSSKLKKFKEGRKNISFLTYDGTFGATDKVLAFIQQFDAAFGDEGFTETSKLCHVPIHFQKSARQWWASLRANGEAPKTRKALKASIMKQFLASNAKDKVLTKWRSLKLSPYESIHKYVDKFWDLHLKATIYKKIYFEEQKQQFCVGLPEDMNKLHIQGYVDKEDFFISPLKHEDVILGAPWFDRLAASIKFPERKISFKFREKDMYINAQESGSSIPLVNDQAFDKSIKSSVFAYMIFVKDSLNGVDETQVNENEMQVDLELSNFLNQFQDVFIDDIPGELPPKRGDDDHMIELIPGSSPPNKRPYRVSQAQQEEIMRQVNELVEKGMVRPSSSPFCSPVLLVQKKDGTYHLPSTHRQVMRLALELAGKLYDLSASSNASRLTIWLADGCLEDPRCVFNALNCVKLQRGPFEHPSTSRITIWIALEFAGKPYDLPASSNANWLTIGLADRCAEAAKTNKDDGHQDKNAEAAKSGGSLEVDQGQEKPVKGQEVPGSRRAKRPKARAARQSQGLGWVTVCGKLIATIVVSVLLSSTGPGLFPLSLVDNLVHSHWHTRRSVEMSHYINRLSTQTRNEVEILVQDLVGELRRCMEGFTARIEAEGERWQDEIQGLERNMCMWRDNTKNEIVGMKKALREEMQKMMDEVTIGLIRIERLLEDTENWRQGAEFLQQSKEECGTSMEEIQRKMESQVASMKVDLLFELKEKVTSGMRRDLDVFELGISKQLALTETEKARRLEKQEIDSLIEDKMEKRLSQPLEIVSSGKEKVIADMKNKLRLLWIAVDMLSKSREKTSATLSHVASAAQKVNEFVA